LTEKHTDIEPDCQRLIFKGKVLKNEQTLAEVKLSDGDCIIVVKSRKKQKRSSTEDNPDEKGESRNTPQASAHTNPPPSVQVNASLNGNQASGFMAPGQPNVANFDALSALFMANSQANPFGSQPQTAAASAQQSAPSASNANAPPAANPFAAMMGQRANNQLPNFDINNMMQMLQNPVMQDMLGNPAIQEMMRNVMQNPAMLQNIMQNNPMLNGLFQNTGNSGFRLPSAAGAPSPAAASMPVPQASVAAVDGAPAATADQRAVNNSAADNAVSGAIPAVSSNAQSTGSNTQPVQANAQAAQPNPLAFLLGQLNNQQPNNGNLPNIFQGFQNAPLSRQPQVLNDTQATEMYAAQLEQLKSMGFNDEGRNLRALRETAGSVEAAINMLLL